MNRLNELLNNMQNKIKAYQAINEVSAKLEGLGCLFCWKRGYKISYIQTAFYAGILWYKKCRYTIEKRLNNSPERFKFLDKVLVRGSQDEPWKLDFVTDYDPQANFMIAKVAGSMSKEIFFPTMATKINLKRK